MRTKVLVSLLAATALALPAAALADHGGGGGGGGGPKQANYELKGTLSAYTAAVGATNGSITIPPPYPAGRTGCTMLRSGMVRV